LAPPRVSLWCESAANGPDRPQRLTDGVRGAPPHLLAVSQRSGSIDPDRFGSALSELAARISRLYLHVDLDSLDSSEATANEHAAPGGPSLDRLLESIRLAAGTLPVAAAAITAYDPSLDDDGRTIRAARRIAVEIARGGRER
jgi:arginase family enzyme